MDEPLFGGISRREIFIERFANAYIISISLVTAAASVVRSIHTGSFLHVFLGLCVVLFAGIEVRLVNWYRVGDLEPRFKQLIIVLGPHLHSAVSARTDEGLGVDEGHGGGAPQVGVLDLRLAQRVGQ
ncbi:hypothetical protein GGI24_005171, partial [Coemansia furcata]